MDTSRYLDDKVVFAANSILKKQFPEVHGFEDTLYINTPQYRTRAYPTAANIFYVGNRHHKISSVYAEMNNINYYESLDPGSEPNSHVLKQFREAYKLTSGTFYVRSQMCQQQHNVDCVVYSVANVWSVCSGLDPSRISFNENTLRMELLMSFMKQVISFSYQNITSRGVAIVYEYSI